MTAPRRTGTASLPLHTGRAPPWLFGRMVRLAREILGHVVADYGPNEVLERLSDPFWFQAFGCVPGFDWHSSGVTTTTCGAIKEVSCLSRGTASSFHTANNAICLAGEGLTPITLQVIILGMIRTFRHKGLKTLYEKNRTKGLNPQWLKRIRAILARLDASKEPDDMDFPGLRLHPMKGDYKGFWVVDVSGNWRIIFRFEEQEPHDVDLVDYH